MAASTFSYAQAAKGMSTPVTQSKPTSGAATPAKDSAPTTASGSAGTATSWADDTETESTVQPPTSAAASREGQQQPSSSAPAQTSQSVENSSISSPDLGASASSASTVTKDDDVSSLPNASSESTWDNKSQASTSVDKSAEPVEKTSEKVKKGKNAVVKPLQEAPLPAVNIWKKRADELKSKTQKPNVPALNGAPQGASGKKNESDARAQSAHVAGKSKGEEDKGLHARKEGKGETDAKKEKRSLEKDARSVTSAQPPPPKRDQESWPTPETVINEDRKKAQEKGEKELKEQKESAPAGPHGKHEWVKVPYTPSVVFNTPLPNAANSRRGGRPGGRGGSQPNGRPSTFGANGAGQPEKDGPVPAVNGDHSKRERADGVAPQDASPKAKRAGSTTSPVLKEQTPAATSEKSGKPFGSFVAEAEFRPRTASSAPDSSQSGHQNGTYPRQYSGRPNKPRRGDMSFAGDRRRDGDVSPTKDNTFDDRQHSAGTQTDAATDGDRRHSAYHDGTNGHQYKQGRYSSHSGGRERGRGGRGGRGNFTHANYSNGHMSAQSTPSFTLGPRSPTTFNPENPSFFAPTQGKYGRSGHRSQSVTNDPYRFVPYQSGPPVAPIQTYNMYDYSMMQQPMSAVPYAPYMDQYALMAMITTQVEYYFSVDNLLKDMYLRRRMDSQGFVSLDFIAGFNRIKHLSTDLELIKLVCQQSSVVQYRTGEDGQDRLRRREGWEQWVLNMSDRDAVAQNEGPKELHQPPVPRPSGFDQSNPSQWPMSAVEPTGPYGNNSSYPQMNGYGHGQDSAPAAESVANGTSEHSIDAAVPNGQPIEASTVSPQPDSFPDEQIATLTIIVRKPMQLLNQPVPVSRTLSNISLDSKTCTHHVSEGPIMCSVKVDSTDLSNTNIDSHVSGLSCDVSIPIRSKSPAPLRLYWVQGEAAPVHSLPLNSSGESYFNLRSKALQQRNDAPPGTTPYDLDVLYKFWSHFLIRNFNTTMYNEFRRFAFDDAVGRMTDVGLSTLMKYYGEAVMSSQLLQSRVAHHYVALMQSEDELHRPAFQHLQLAVRGGKITSRNWDLIARLLNDDMLASLTS